LDCRATSIDSILFWYAPTQKEISMIDRHRIRAITVAIATGVGFLAVAAAPANAATAIEYGLSAPAPAPAEGTDSSVIRPEQMAVGNGASTDASISKPPQ
jgi:hypothetical protein